MHLGADILVPDLAGWRRERMPALVADEPFFTLAPDWVCEVLSPTTVKHDRAGKLRIYARERVPFAWLVDPLGRTLEVLVLGPSPPAAQPMFPEHAWTTAAVHADDAKVRAAPFEAIVLDLAILWADVVLPAPRG